MTPLDTQLYLYMTQEPLILNINLSKVLQK